ncbi:endolytic transglycosylase MltG [Candidatus Peregrinibacteria bacterium CG10_big_fil_rev_8_21_14_0_10_49_16]|nr:MAG: hypothetical protein COW95_00105 [Candidatus Peregrinibacteria bacterium CG22_combo_CG10-13_8_21_14_all_49_11]PIR52293.1 MAG: endolytic transglycosylase MltG [Candidatus Peregrinibacteria bacterium CG10_big_fil_rev_8_21_14_0_10_49_16]
MRKLIITFLIATIGSYFWYGYNLGPVSKKNAKREQITIEQGMSVEQITNLLAEKGMIRSPLAFKLHVAFNGLSAALQAGTFIFDQSMNAEEVVMLLTTGKSKEIRITIPEGFTVKDIDALLAEQQLIEAGDILDCLKVCDFSSFEFLPDKKDLARRGGKLEGYLFPDTYYVEPGNFVPKFFLERMLNAFRSRVLRDLYDDLATSERSVHEMITMAALIEEETQTDEERPVVAGILWKRYDEGMGLGVDATVRYILDKPTGVLTGSDLNTDSQYNLRKFRGLTPGPIASPGIKSIQAALRPEKSEYWYYLHGSDGQIHYAVTNEEHNMNKYKYLH